jgi:hypothetical protein
VAVRVGFVDCERLQGFLSTVFGGLSSDLDGGLQLLSER